LRNFFKKFENHFFKSTRNLLPWLTAEIPSLENRNSYPTFNYNSPCSVCFCSYSPKQQAKLVSFPVAIAMILSVFCRFHRMHDAADNQSKLSWTNYTTTKQQISNLTLCTLPLTNEQYLPHNFDKDRPWHPHNAVTNIRLRPPSGQALAKLSP